MICCTVVTMSALLYHLDKIRKVSLIWNGRLSKIVLMFTIHQCLVEQQMVVDYEKS